MIAVWVLAFVVIGSAYCGPSPQLEISALKSESINGYPPVALVRKARQIGEFENIF